MKSARYAFCIPAFFTTTVICVWMVDEKKCLTCGGCVGVCPAMALELNSNYGLSCDTSRCTLCGTCEKFCPVGAIKVVREKK